MFLYFVCFFAKQKGTSPKTTFWISSTQTMKLDAERWRTHAASESVTPVSRDVEKVCANLNHYLFATGIGLCFDRVVDLYLECNQLCVGKLCISKDITSFHDILYQCMTWYTIVYNSIYNNRECPVRPLSFKGVNIELLRFGFALHCTEL